MIVSPSIVSWITGGLLARKRVVVVIGVTLMSLPMDRRTVTSLGAAEPSGAQELLLEAALLDADRALQAWRRWKQLETIDAADDDSLRLMPLVCRNLLALGADEPEIGVLKSAYRHQWVAATARLDGAGLAISALSGAGVPTMVLKGAALAGAYYRDLGVRPMHDIDILVPTERALDAAAALERGGWAHAVATPLRELLPVTHGSRFDASNVGVDLHWHVMWSPADEHDFWSAAEPAEVGGAATLRPCAADLLLHACVHAVWSDGMRLRWVPDALAVLRASPDLDWERVVERARARELTLPLHAALGYLVERFGAAVPAAVLRDLDATGRGAWERAGHRAWIGRQTGLRTAVLVCDRYRRHRVDPPGPTRCRNFVAYMRHYSAMTWGPTTTVGLGPAIVSRLLRRRGRPPAPEPH
jgi:hypothetical protein